MIQHKLLGFSRFTTPQDTGTFGDQFSASVSGATTHCVTSLGEIPGFFFFLFFNRDFSFAEQTFKNPLKIEHD